MSDFRSPTAYAFPQSKADCQTPEDCVLFAIKKIQQKMKNTKTIVQKTLMEVCFMHFDAANSGWFEGAINNLTNAGVILNENLGLENIAPVYYIKLERAVVKQAIVPKDPKKAKAKKSETRKKKVTSGKKINKFTKRPTKRR